VVFEITHVRFIVFMFLNQKHDFVTFLRCGTRFVEH